MVDDGAAGMTLRSDYTDDEDPPAPSIEGTLHDPPMKSSARIKGKVDTGFSGGLLISAQQYLELGLQYYEEPQEAISGLAATGVVVPLNASKGVFQLGSERINCAVYSTPLLSKPLIGRGILNRWRTILDGPRKQLEIEL
jgi:predicted aspartyl protease